jgi:hypothetical protein
MTGAAYVIKIYKIINGVRNYCGSTEPSGINEDDILRQWGGGKYTLFATLNNKYVPGGSITINLFARPIDALKPSDTSSNVVLNAASGEVAILQQSLNRQHEMILAMLQNNQKSESPSLIELIQVVKEMTPKPPDMAASMASMMDLFKSSMDLAKETAGLSDGKPDWLKIVDTIAGKLPQIVGVIGAMRKAPVAPENSNPEIAESAGMSDEQKQKEAANKILLATIAQLKPEAMKSTDPELIVDWIDAHRESTEYHNMAVAILNKPFEEICAMDADIGKEPLKSWFKKLYDSLRELFYERLNSDASAGTDGSDSNPDGNAATHD